MAHYHKARQQQAKKWQRFEARYGMKPAQWREFKRTMPGKECDAIRQRAHQLFIKQTPSVKA